MRTDSHAATLALLVCLLFANGCASVLNWDRQGEIDVVETPDQPPPMLEEVVENSARKPLALRRDDPPPPPDGILDDQPERRVAKPAEFVDQLRGDNALTAEEQKAIETLKQKSPAAAEFLASRAGDPTQRNLAQLHSETVAKPPAGESQGIDLLREGSTMPPPSLGTPGAATSPAESYPSQARLGTPGPLNEPQGSRAIALQANPAQPQLPIVEYGQPPAQGNSAPLVGDQRMPPRTDVTSPQGGLSPDPRFASNDPQSIRMPNVQHGNPSSQGGLGPQAYTDPRQATYDRNQPLPHHPTQPLGSQSNPYTASQGGQRDPQVARSPNGTAPAAGSPQMIINKHVEQRGGQPQEGVVQASFNGGYQSTQTPNGPQADRNAEPIHWRQHLEHAIAALEEELNQAHVARDSYGKAPAEGEEANAPRRLLPLQQQEIAELEAQLRMLYLSAGMREAAVAPVEYY